MIWGMFLFHPRIIHYFEYFTISFGKIIIRAVHQKPEATRILPFGLCILVWGRERGQKKSNCHSRLPYLFISNRTAPLEKRRTVGRAFSAPSLSTHDG